jgi:cytochrome c biogenesis protein CcmG/thiol:disulfide interchange protein DsbE
MQQETNKTDATATAPAGRSKWVIYLPLALFLLIAVLFIKGLTNEKGGRYIPSTLIGKPLPEFALVPMDGLDAPSGGAMPTFSSAELKSGKVSIINVWSSWCGSCRFEHKFLERLAKESGAALYGLNYKDTAVDGRGFLARYGNPYHAIGMDVKGRVGIDLGVYGVPETFIVDGQGIVRYKLPGPVDDNIIDKELLPAIKKAQAANGQAG